jgi:hypothetical protein
MRISSFVFGTALLIVIGSVPVVGQQSGYMKTNVDPGRAGVFVDGKYMGPARNFGVGRKYTVAPGEHEVKLSEPRYEEVVKKVTIEPGKTVHVAETMKKLPPPKPPFGRLRTITTDKYAAVYVNGRFMGHAGEFNNPVQGLDLNPGDYKVKIVPLGGGEGHEESVKIEADKVAIVRSGK